MLKRRRSKQADKVLEDWATAWVSLTEKWDKCVAWLVEAMTLIMQSTEDAVPLEQDAQQAIITGMVQVLFDIETLIEGHFAPDGASELAEGLRDFVEGYANGNQERLGKGTSTLLATLGRILPDQA